MYIYPGYHAIFVVYHSPAITPPVFSPSTPPPGRHTYQPTPHAWLVPATYHRSFCKHCDQRVGRSPYRTRPVQISWRSLGFVGRCLSRTRNLAASSEHFAELFSGRSWPKIDPGIIFSEFLKSLKKKKRKICAQSERYRNILAGISVSLTYYGNTAFPFSRSNASRFFRGC